MIHVSARGRVLTRYVPKGRSLTGTDYPVVEALPAVLLHRKNNRGFEGLAQLPGGDLMMAVQSPLSLPDGDAGDASRTTRLLRFSPKKRAVTAEYAYRFDPVNVVDPSEDGTSELKISSVVAIGRDPAAGGGTHGQGGTVAGGGTRRAARTSSVVPGTATRRPPLWNSSTIPLPPASRARQASGRGPGGTVAGVPGRSRASRAWTTTHSRSSTTTTSG